MQRRERNRKRAAKRKRAKERTAEKRSGRTEIIAIRDSLACIKHRFILRDAQRWTRVATRTRLRIRSRRRHSSDLSFSFFRVDALFSLCFSLFSPRLFAYVSSFSHSRSSSFVRFDFYAKFAFLLLIFLLLRHHLLKKMIWIFNLDRNLFFSVTIIKLIFSLVSNWCTADSRVFFGIYSSISWSG